MDSSEMYCQVVASAVSHFMFDTDLGYVHSPPCKRRGGRAISKTDPFRKKARTGWSLTSDASECVCETCRVSDHPVCGSSVASRLLIDAAATPPLQGRECTQTETCVLVKIYKRIRAPPSPGQTLGQSLPPV